MLATTLMLTPLACAAAATPADLSYGGKNFQALADDSYRLAGMPGHFQSWLADAYLRGGVPLAGGQTLDQALARRKAQLQAAKSPAEKDALARDTAAWAHKFIKKVVPKFSLERGFEFASIVKTGERQCLLQSTIITGLLQKAGLDAGLVMVWKSMSGQESNLGHVTSVLRLPIGAGDLQVDASEPQPFASHQGILGWADGDYRFLAPQFGPQGLITSYRQVGGAGAGKPAHLSFLSMNYVRSQFSYYRGERASGGVLGTGGRATPAGLKTSERWLRQALKEEPRNALAASVLGTVLRKEGQLDQARQQYRQAAALYAAEGHTPAGMQANLAWANGKGQ
ncbi:hypothetical protein [Deinococcus sp. Marseille-Q6407]|uniref:hypothetical protein n=1 Tax=Deinococcus sp. Marseille-Q6407 TaxID=2969223 RepID=UPI0021C0DED0|nr:hypothetical protein [Deinococcus sp. Marseille-Q6407]